MKGIRQTHDPRPDNYLRYVHSWFISRGVNQDKPIRSNFDFELLSKKSNFDFELLSKKSYESNPIVFFNHKIDSDALSDDQYFMRIFSVLYS